METEVKLEKLIKKLKECKGSLVSIAIPSDVSDKSEVLRVLSRGNTDSVKIVKDYLKQIPFIPPNGYLLFGGILMPETRKIIMDMEPSFPLCSSFVSMENYFCVDALEEWLVHLSNDSPIYGFVIITKESCVFGKLQGKFKKILGTMTSSLIGIAKHSPLFSETKKDYLEKIIEETESHFQNKKIEGFIVASPGPMKKDLVELKNWKGKLLGLLDISCGGEQGFHEAIRLSNSVLDGNILNKELQWLDKFFEEIQLDRGKCCYGLEETYNLFISGAVEIVFLWDHLDTTFYLSSEGECSLISPPFQEGSFTGHPFKEWVLENASKYKTNVEFISDQTARGKQFIKGYGGIGGLLRWNLSS